MGAGPLDWMMLEPFVFRWDDGFSFPGGRTMPFRAQGTSSHGGPFTVGIRIVAPPGISRLYLHWPGGPKEGSSCTLMAVHHNLLMFRLTSSPVKMRDESLIWRQEYFITQGGQLHQIPECTQRSLHLQSVGILPGSEQSYVIAQLCLNRSRLPAKIEAELCILHSNKWKLLPNLRIEHKAHELSDFSRWRTDRVICFQDNLCWVSYFSGGILFSDVLSKKPNISYLRLPINDQHRCTEYHRLQDMHCSLCITDSGSKLMFISVTPEDLNIVGPMLPGTDFIVTCHTLATLGTEEGRWERGFFISSNELWGSNVSLPLNALMFPFVSVTKSNELYFLLSEQGEGGIDKVSVIALDTNSSAVTSHPYIEGGTDLSGKDGDMVRKKSRHIDPFFLFQFPSSLGPTRYFT
jgi:hypothetical protein